ncbi:MMPL family transporter [Streptomyces zagrosensis]|uniref:RND superfamily putative drug exporter n=1 Tax=Streptomyces zagrosensis TaxID=1042984 RepID=A0A7W9V0P1_9ACTN|nr:efflux RND transporter permease subunit [Streptomyces zagrosensis]MBB5936974.1 RND superfamily putative drug exporter [Streptomyces zagrosensis]
MLDRLASLILPRPKKILLAMLIIVLAVGGASMGLADRLTMGGYENTDTESHKTEKILEKEFEQGRPNLSIVVSDPRGVDDPEVTKAGLKLTQGLADNKHVANVASYWSMGKAPSLKGESGQQALISGRILGDFDEVNDRVQDLEDEYSGKVEGLKVELGGTALMNFENVDQSAKDASKAETLVFPLVLVVLVIIFGSLVAAALPLAVALATMLLVFGLLYLITFAFDANNLLTNVTTLLGLGLAIDYSLLFITRYREELQRGFDTHDAIRATMRQVGRTITFSAVTLAIALMSLVVMPFGMFQSIAVGGAATSLVAAFGTLTIVPALLAWAGPRIDKLRLIRRKPRPVAESSEGGWHRMALFVMRKPVPLVVAVLALMTLLGSPVRDLNLRLPDEQILPKSAQSAKVAKTVQEDFNNREAQAMQVVARDIGDVKARDSDITAYATKLSALPNVARVDALTGSYAKGEEIAPRTKLSEETYGTDSSTYFSVVPAVDGLSPKGEDIVRDIRDADSPFPVKVGGHPAISVDTFDVLTDNLPLALGIMAIGAYILLFLLTGSLLLPLMAIVLSVLSLSATFGSLVFVFQDGHMQWLVGDFINTGAINWTVPVLVGTLGFGLSMDYAVFILSRVKEEYDRTGDNELAVATGLERVGKVVTYAAIILSLVFIVMLTSGISYMKALGLGVPLAILLDATLIRGILLPASMRLLGEKSWWAPGPMRKFHDRFGISESAPPVPPSSTADEGNTSERAVDRV